MAFSVSLSILNLEFLKMIETEKDEEIDTEDIYFHE